MAGLRVFRGGDWKWGESQDGGEGHCGTTTGIKTKPGWVKVLWDNGNKNDYRAGANDACDLLVLDNGPAGVRHPGIVCDACQETDIRGLRWKCVDCPDYDLCTECYGKDRHDTSHKFKRADIPNADWSNVGKRRNAIKLQSKGLYASAKVVRGVNWDKANQDGGAGSVGTVTKVGYLREDERYKAVLVVKWPHDPNTGYIYRRGLGGNVDVKYKVPASGWFYYRDHLPQLRDVAKLAKTIEVEDDGSKVLEAAEMFQKMFLSALTHTLVESTGTVLEATEVDGEQRKRTLANFAVRDFVRLDDNIDNVKKLQEDHGGFNTAMVETLGKTGVVTDIDKDGDLSVVFGAEKWFINPKLVTKQRVQETEPARPKASTGSRSAFRPGDRIVLSKDVSETRSLQEGHGGWQEGIEQLARGSTVGVMRDSTISNDILVSFGDKLYILNPDVCTRASEEKPITPGVSKPRTFNVGDRVTIDRDIDFVKRSQKGHGGWKDSMKMAVRSCCVVKEIDKDGDLNVESETTKEKWIFNPEVCHLCKAEGIDSGVTPSKLVRISGTHTVMKEWKRLARILGVAETDVMQIEHAHRNDLKECVYQMLFKWQGQNSRINATIRALSEALKEVGMKKIAEDIEEMDRIS